MPDLNWADVLLVLSYEPETGQMLWRERRGRAMPGQQAGTVDKDGYLQVVVFGKSVKVHRLAWFMHFGVWPAGEIDHINGLRADNRIENLRVVSRGENCRNLHKHPPNECGHIGAVRQVTGKFGAKVRFEGEHYWLGTFETAEEASRAYLAGRRCKTREELRSIRDTYRAKVRELKKEQE